jgi:hypothetical protein
MKGLDYKIRTAILLLAVILFCSLLVRSVRNAPLVSGRSPVPVIVEVQGDIPKPGIYIIAGEEATILNVLAAVGWSGSVPQPLGAEKITSGQSLTLHNRSGDPEIRIDWMPAAARLASGQKLDLNTASVNDLLLIPKMRSDMAYSIVKRRAAKEWGSIDELQEIHGIGPKTSQAFEEYLRVVPAK